LRSASSAARSTGGALAVPAPRSPFATDRTRNAASCRYALSPPAKKRSFYAIASSPGARLFATAVTPSSRSRVLKKNSPAGTSRTGSARSHSGGLPLRSDNARDRSGLQAWHGPDQGTLQGARITPSSINCAMRAASSPRPLSTASVCSPSLGAFERNCPGVPASFGTIPG